MFVCMLMCAVGIAGSTLGSSLHVFMSCVCGVRGHLRMHLPLLLCFALLRQGLSLV